MKTMTAFIGAALTAATMYFASQVYSAPADTGRLPADTRITLGESIDLTINNENTYLPAEADTLCKKNCQPAKETDKKIKYVNFHEGWNVILGAGGNIESANYAIMGVDKEFFRKPLKHYPGEQFQLYVGFECDARLQIPIDTFTIPAILKYDLVQNGKIISTTSKDTLCVVRGVGFEISPKITFPYFEKPRDVNKMFGISPLIGIEKYFGKYDEHIIITNSRGVEAIGTKKTTVQRTHIYAGAAIELMVTPVATNYGLIGRIGYNTVIAELGKSNMPRDPYDYNRLWIELEINFPPNFLKAPRKNVAEFHQSVREAGNFDEAMNSFKKTMKSQDKISGKYQPDSPGSVNHKTKKKEFKGSSHIKGYGRVRKIHWYY